MSNIGNSWAYEMAYHAEQLEAATWRGDTSAAAYHRKSYAKARENYYKAFEGATHVARNAKKRGIIEKLFAAVFTKKH